MPAAVAALLLAAVPATASETKSAVTIRLVSTPGRTVVKDVPPRTLPNGQFTRGDRMSGTSILSNAVAQLGRPKGARVGTDTYSMTVTTPPRARILITVQLPSGTLKVDGVWPLTARVLRVPVVGGTGAYAGAKGTAEATSLGGDRTLNVYRVSVP